MIQQKNILISGTTSGIGRATALRLARENHNIITLNRPGSREEKAFQKLQATGTGTKHQYFVDLSTARAVREAAARNRQGNPSSGCVNQQCRGYFRPRNDLARTIPN